MQAANHRHVSAMLADVLVTLHELLASRLDERDVALVDLAGGQPAGIRAIQQVRLGSQDMSEAGAPRWAGSSFMDGARDFAMCLYGSARVRGHMHGRRSSVRYTDGIVRAQNPVLRHRASGKCGTGSWTSTVLVELAALRELFAVMPIC